MLGIETIGNATLIAFDEKPVIATDPWFDEHAAYFGSWGLSHRIPKDQREHIFACDYIWFSHGHPDHMNPESVEYFRSKKILLSEHRGQRIYNDLVGQGYDVTILKDREWINLSPRIRVLSIADYIQDSVLLLDVGGYLFLDVNDAGLRYCKNFVKRIAKNFDRIFLLMLSGYGDADMINIFDESGERVLPRAASKPKVGKEIRMRAEVIGATDVVPFSSLHKYQREDSNWANAYTTPLTAYREGFDSLGMTLHEPFIRVDVSNGEISNIAPEQTPDYIYKPEEFGDNWADELEKEDLTKIDAYFNQIEVLKSRIGFIEFIVGGKTHVIQLSKKTIGVTFQCPRNSLLTAINYQVFDDLLIGNFMKTVFHGMRSLYEPDFTFSVCKIADNGRAQTHREVSEYMRDYRDRSSGEWLREEFANITARYMRRYVPRNNRLFEPMRRLYHHFR